MPRSQPVWGASIFPLTEGTTPLTGPPPSWGHLPGTLPCTHNTPAFFVILQELQLVIGVGSLHDVHQAEGGAEHLPTFLQDMCGMFQTCRRGRAPAGGGFRPAWTLYCHLWEAPQKTHVSSGPGEPKEAGGHRCGPGTPGLLTTHPLTLPRAHPNLDRQQLHL